MILYILIQPIRTQRIHFTWSYCESLNKGNMRRVRTVILWFHIIGWVLIMWLFSWLADTAVTDSIFSAVVTSQLRYALKIFYVQWNLTKSLIKHIKLKRLNRLHRFYAFYVFWFHETEYFFWISHWILIWTVFIWSCIGHFIFMWIITKTQKYLDVFLIFYMYSSKIILTLFYW